MEEKKHGFLLWRQLHQQEASFLGRDGVTQRKPRPASIWAHAWCSAFLPRAQADRWHPDKGSPGLGSVKRRTEHGHGSQEAQL